MKSTLKNSRQHRGSQNGSVYLQDTNPTTMNKLFVLLFSICLLHSQSNACIDPPNTVTVSLLADTANCQMLIEVANLNMMGGDPNQFCSCAINDQISNIGEIQYIAFVDSTTDVPVIGFEQFLLNSNASDAWGAVDNNYDWNGFVSEVGQSGLVAGQAIKLWIRLSMHPEVTMGGVTFDPCEYPEYFTEEEFFLGAIGSDEWNEDTQTLALDHLGIAYFFESSISLTILDEEEFSYYDNLIESFYLGIDEASHNEFRLFRNPVDNQLQIIGLRDIRHEIIIYDVYGKQVLFTQSSSGLIDIHSLTQGVYLINISGQRYNRVLRFLKE